MKRNRMLFILVIQLLSVFTFGQVPLSISQTYDTETRLDAIKKDNLTISGNFSGGWATHTLFWTANSQVGYIISDNLIGGVQVGLGNYKMDAIFSKALGKGELEINTFSITPEIYTRYYISKLRIKPFLQLSTGYNFQLKKERNTTEELVRTHGNYVASGAAGISFLLGKKLTFEVLYNQQILTKPKFLYDANRHLKLRLGMSFFINR